MRGTFAGANIKGTPAMSAKAVREDLRVLRGAADVFGVQEFKWSWYWTAVLALLPGWATYPAKRAGLSDPSAGAQALFWKKRLFKRMARYAKPAFNFDLNHRGVMDQRYIRAVLLRAREDGFTGWFLSTHFVVGGDRRDDPAQRRALMNSNLIALDKTLTHLRATGYPIMGELDANISKGTVAYDELMGILQHHKATVHGTHGVEYSFTIPGDDFIFADVQPQPITTAKLRTDHEVRLLHWEGRRRARQR